MLSLFQIEMSQALVNGSSFKPIWTTYNTRFTEFELWFRFMFLLMAFGSAVALCQSLRKYSIEVLYTIFGVSHAHYRNFENLPSLVLRFLI